MSRDKQIEEMAKAQKCNSCIHNAVCEQLEDYRDPLGWLSTNDEYLCSYYDAGYHKASDVINKFSEELIERFNDLEYYANTPRKTVKVDELQAQMDWILHEVAINTIKEFSEKYVEAMK